MISSITLLTKKRRLWAVGLTSSAVGVVAAIFGLLLK